ncbi:hypothetical protein [Campylobacter vulpis]|uniref:hypothetical protein n=1 Tax=Campylobacter vulpis TaxID=1655500 RepID=UPI000C159E20|nr:hypothetical protein [Campylobacter vulpis]MBS4275599.1 hypothetical protein [Campylobacter vulpis]MBS4306818.1 hypothetical protein [Campylobacter vulpis]MBS4329926.1 hypothetical protein [Campylobacter vulpis]MBS4423573.1 hypothetical protein [Campylobacter vulpis]PHY89916.1 hypothetical protein AA995_07195 [Campylobacter vulpis]
MDIFTAFTTIETNGDFFKGFIFGLITALILCFLFFKSLFKALVKQNNEVRDKIIEKNNEANKMLLNDAKESIKKLKADLALCDEQKEGFRLKLWEFQNSSFK